MDKRHKDILRGLVLALRRELLGMLVGQSKGKERVERWERGDLDREMERLGFAPDGHIQPIDALPTINAYEQRAYRTIFVQLQSLSDARRIAVRREIIERAAYTWINRLLALRAMEARALIDNTLRGDVEYGGLSEKLYILRLTEPQRATGEDGGWWAVIEDACQMLAQALPGLFALDDPNVVLRPGTPTLLRCIALTNGTTPLPATPTLAALDATFADPDAIGWAYQFYQQGPKEQIYEKLKKSGKAGTREEIAAATQLFTEPYMVQWLLQNSLGRSYHLAYPASSLPATWPYYVVLANEQTEPPPPSLANLTLLDPCVGSGHFLREAFDMLVAMYREQHPDYTARTIAQRILTQHLHGIDLDPRAAQLTALTLYMRAWELVRDERRAQHQQLSIAEIPAQMNLATTPRIPNGGALQRHLQRHPEDAPLEALLKSIFSSLEQADILGSLLRPREYLASVIANLQKPETISMDMSENEADWYRSLKELAFLDANELTQRLLQRVSMSFDAETSNSDDVSAALFGRAALEGVKLLQLLMQSYAIVVTNPPYMGSKNMDTPLKRYVERHYPSGKRDLYAAFILRCLELCQPNGRVAMVTMQSWMFLRSYADLRAIPAEKLIGEQKKGRFTGILRETSIEVLAQLGPHAFEEISGEAVQCSMFALWKQNPQHHLIVAFRLVGLQNAFEKALYLSRNIGKFVRKNEDFVNLPNSPLGFWLSDSFLQIIRSGKNIRAGARTKAGLTTWNSPRYYRKHWEISDYQNWVRIANGGPFRKWFGNDIDYLRWGKGWVNILRNTGNKLPSMEYYSIPGVFLSQNARGCLSGRLSDGGFTNSSVAIFPMSPFTIFDIATWINNHCASYLVRLYSQKMGIEAKHLDDLPLILDETCRHISQICFCISQFLAETRPIEASFSLLMTYYNERRLEVTLLTSEAVLEKRVIYLLGLTSVQSEITQSTGTPAGWYPLITNYDALPPLPDELALPPLPDELFAYLAEHERVVLDEQELMHVKARLRVLYEAGPGAKLDEPDELEETSEEDEESEELASGAHIPIPTETFLEELSVKLQLHPISVYWLLQALRAEGVRCLPEEREALEDRLSVLALRLLGHRWPRQIEAREPRPAWVVQDGILPLVAIPGMVTLAEHVRRRLIDEDGEAATQSTEKQLQALTGYTLEEWLQRRFFARHISQFKSRPIAWHLSSTPTVQPGTGKRSRNGRGQRPAFECLLYYHGCTEDVLARIRTLYLEPLIRAEQAKLAPSTPMQQLTLGDEQADEQTRKAHKVQQDEREITIAFATQRLHELKDFAERLHGIEDSGFACAELETLLVQEPLDRWSGDGLTAPASYEAWQHAEEAWHVDINDGVRVNIAPLQLAGVLTKEAKDVLAKRGDAQKAIIDRAHWRADERRWVRDGKLPRSGWLPEHVPASEQWIDDRADETNRTNRAITRNVAPTQKRDDGQPAQQTLTGLSESENGRASARHIDSN